MADSEVNTEQSEGTEITSVQNQETRANVAELMEKLWSAVETGKDKELRKFFNQNEERDIPLNRDNEEFDEDGGHILIFCVKEGCNRGNSFGRDFVQCVRILLTNEDLDIDVQDKSERTALHWAVLGKNANFCTLLMNAGADPTIEDHDGLSPFHIAIQKGYKDILKILSSGQDKEIYSKKDGKGTPPLVTAVNTGNIDICRFLLENGAKIDATDRRLKRSALQYAILAKNLDIFDLLLKYNPSLDQGDYRGKTALHRICAIKDPRYFQRVIKHYGTFPDHIMEQETDDGVTPVISACQSGNSQQLKELIDQGASILTKDDNGRTALHYCADNLETQCAEMLLAKDPSLLEVKDSQGFTPLHMSVISGNVPLLKLLLKKGADIRSLDSELHTPTHWATAKHHTSKVDDEDVCGHLEILDILIDNGAELSSADSHNAYPIHYAAQMNGKDSNHADSKVGEKVLKKLLDSGVPHDVTDKDGRQPLLWAASAGNTESIKLLVKAGADVNAIDKDGLSALHCAASRGHSHCIEELKKLGADVNLADKNSCTPLFYAVTLGNKDCTKTLLKHGADPNHQDVRGRTPSHCASVKGCVETLKILDKSKADLWGSSGRGDFPIHEAAQGGHCDVVKYLLKWKNTPEAVNTPNNAGRTCLHIAAIINNLPLCKLLLDNGAEKNSLMMHKNKKDASKDKSYTPYDAAILKDNRETAEYIKSKGGNSGGDIDNILNKKDKREGKSAKSRKSNLESHKEEEENQEQDKKSEKQEDTEGGEKKEEKPKSKKELEKEKREAEKAKKEEEKKKKEEELKAKKEEEKKKKEEEKKQKEEEKKKKEEEKKQKEEEESKKKEEEKEQKEEAKKKEKESQKSSEEKSDKKEEVAVAAAAAVAAEEKEKDKKEKEEGKKGKKESSKEGKENKGKEKESKDKAKDESKEAEKEDQLESDEEVVVVKGKKVVRKKKGYVKDKEAEKARKEAEEAKKDVVKAHQEAELAKAAAEKAKLEKEKQDQQKKKSAKQKKEDKEDSNKGKGKEKTKKDEKAVAAGAVLAAKGKKGKKDPNAIQEEDEEEDETTKESGIEAEKAKREAEKSKKEAEELRQEAEEANKEVEKLNQAAVAANAAEEVKESSKKKEEKSSKGKKDKEETKEDQTKPPKSPDKAKDKKDKEEKAKDKNDKGEKAKDKKDKEEKAKDKKVEPSTPKSGKKERTKSETKEPEPEESSKEKTKPETPKTSKKDNKEADKDESDKKAEVKEKEKEEQSKKSQSKKEEKQDTKDLEKEKTSAKKTDKQSDKPLQKKEKTADDLKKTENTEKTESEEKPEDTKEDKKELVKEKSTVSKVDKSKKSSEKSKVEKEKTELKEEDKKQKKTAEKPHSQEKSQKKTSEEKPQSPEKKQKKTPEEKPQSPEKTDKKTSEEKLQSPEKKQKKTSEKVDKEEKIQEDTVDTGDVDERVDSGVHTPGSVAEEEDLEKHLVAASTVVEKSGKGKKKNKLLNQPSTSTPKGKHRPTRKDNEENKVPSRDSGRPNTRDKNEFQEVELQPSRDSGNHSQSEERNSQTEDRQSQTKHNLLLSPSLSPVDYQENSPHQKDAFVQTPKSRSVHTEKNDDEDEFEFPENSHENQEAALRLAESRRQSKQEPLPETPPQDLTDRESRGRRRASKIPDSGVIQPGLKSRENSRSKTPVLTNGHSQQNNDYVETSEEDDDVITEINFQNRLRRIEKAQIARNKQKEQYLLQQLKRTQKPNYKLAPVRKHKSNITLADMERLETSGRRRNVPRRVASIQESVRRYQDQRRFVRQMHQLKRAQIYTGPMHDIVLFSKMMDVYKHSTPGESENDLEMSTMENWDSYLRDQLRFVSHYYDEDQSVRDQTNKVRRETSDTRRGVESRSEYLAQSLKRKEEQDAKEKTDMDGRISNLTRKTEDLYDSVKEKADQTLKDARDTNASLDKYYRKERSDLIHNSHNSRPHSYRKLKDEEEMDERQRLHEEREKARKEKHSEWHKKKEEDLRRRLMKVYGNGSEHNFSKSRNFGHMKSSTPRTQSIGTSSGSRPKSMMSSISGSRAQYSNSTDQELSVQMTEFGLRRVKKMDDGAYGRPSRDPSQCSIKSLLFHRSGSMSANWTPKFDGDVRPRAGLVFVEPKVYTEFLKEEAQIRNQTAMMARSRSTNIHTLEDDATVLETVES